MSLINVKEGSSTEENSHFATFLQEKILGKKFETLQTLYVFLGMNGYGQENLTETEESESQLDVTQKGLLVGQLILASL